MSADDRYWYLIRRLADAEEVWLLAVPTGSPLTLEMEPGRLVYPIWTEREFAEAAAPGTSGALRLVSLARAQSFPVIMNSW